MIITAWLKEATDELADAMFDSPRLDAEIILAHTLQHPRTYLHAHGDEEIEPRLEEIANARIELRKDHVPVAYIIGHKEFYGRRFHVSPAVLIPRPESEQLIEMLKKIVPDTAPLPGIAPKRLVDIGTGSGCLGLTTKLEFPDLSVDLIDNSRHALTIAKKNARQFDVDIEVFLSDLLLGYPYTPDYILANLPYVDPSWEISDELSHEPSEALFANDQGLAVIKRCLEQAATRLPKGGYLLLEADTRQLDIISSLARHHGFHETTRDSYALCFEKTSR